MSRPEHVGPADLFYNELESKKYALNSRMMDIQSKMSERAVQLLGLPKDSPAIVIDIGCGSGLSGEVLTEAGIHWVGVDIAPSMLGVALQRDVRGDLLCADIGHGLNFRPAVFDGAISISVVQWLCQSDHSMQKPMQRMRKFFDSLYAILKRGAKAVLQFYPETPQQMALITETSLKAGFSGGLVVDHPNSTKAKKFFLCLRAGEPWDDLPAAVDGKEATEDNMEDVAAKEGVDGQYAQFSMGMNMSKSKSNRRERPSVKSREWILAKKERMRKQGKSVANDSKYTGRKRGPKF